MAYVRGWAEGKRAADDLAEMLRAFGLEVDLPGLKADVNVFGDGVVTLGAVRPDAARLLADLLTTGLTAEMTWRDDGRPGLGGTADSSAA
ncbi:hypothetical protein G3260_004841 [Streptomyces albus]|uniref:Uncharacterized protein n=1 Tax=Streptomyces albus TaxID=1888 RepID=A0A6C1CFU3_9ACTN|nr:hypothetical protein G3260_004841 [Streptomyces albus]TGG76631.1 hypothetical protein D8771_28995 [Streptomyces albus]